MPSFKKNLIADCLIDDQSVDDQPLIGNQNYDGQADQVTVSCDSFESRVNDLLDERIDLSKVPSLQVHAEGCLSCRLMLRQYEQLALMLGSARGNVELSSDADQRQNKLWQNLPAKMLAPLTIVAMLAVLVVTGQFFNGATNVEALPNAAVATANSTNLPAADSPELVIASSEALPVVNPVSWSSQRSVQQLQGLVASGSELLAARREQVAVIQGLSDVRLDLDLVELEAQLAALQPVLNYSGRIPALSPMQGTVCFTLGWLKKGKAVDEPKLHAVPATGADLGMSSLALRDMA